MRTFNYFEFELDRNYEAEELISAIEQGYDYWQANVLPYYVTMQDRAFIFGDWPELVPPTSSFAYVRINNGVVDEWEVLGNLALASDCSSIEALEIQIQQKNSSGTRVRQPEEEAVLKIMKNTDRELKEN